MPPCRQGHRQPWLHGRMDCTCRKPKPRLLACPAVMQDAVGRRWCMKGLTGHSRRPALQLRPVSSCPTLHSTSQRRLGGTACCVHPFCRLIIWPGAAPDLTCRHAMGFAVGRHQLASPSERRGGLTVLTSSTKWCLTLDRHWLEGRPQRMCEGQAALHGACIEHS